MRGVVWGLGSGFGDSFGHGRGAFSGVSRRTHAIRCACGRVCARGQVDRARVRTMAL